MVRERVSELRHRRARFAKWRAVITIGEGRPTRNALRTNAHALARYAALCPEGAAGAIVEPEVPMNGDHTLQRCAEVTRATLETLMAELDGPGGPRDHQCRPRSIPSLRQQAPTSLRVRRVTLVTMAPTG